MPVTAPLVLTRLLIAPICLAVAGSAYSSSDVAHVQDPLRFFEGRTEMTSKVKVMMKAPFRSRTIGRGEIHPDGSLSLVQQVHNDGKPVEQRQWKMRKIGPGRYSGTMSEAKGPVTAEEVGGRYRFRFKTKNGLSVEQWLAPLPGGNSARSTATIRKVGVRVASSTGMIRRL